MSVAESQSALPKPGIRWFHLSPDRLVICLLPIEGGLLLSEWLNWLPKGCAVLTALASIGGVALLMLLWLALALLFRRRFQFGIRTLLVFTLVCGIECSWLTVRMGQARKQKAAVAAILKQSGQVRYDDSFLAFNPPVQQFYGGGSRRGPIMYPAVRPAATWLRKLFGDDMFQSVVEVVTWRDAALEHIKDLPGLQSLDLYCGAGVTDKGLAQLREVPGLRRLHFAHGEEVTADGLANLRYVTHLKRLDMRNERICAAVSAKYLQGLTELEELSLGPYVADAELTYLAGLSKLRSLDLSDTYVTAAGLEHLKGLTQLRTLNLSGTQVTDAGLERLKGLTQLRTLNLSGTRVTDAGLICLRSFSELEVLSLDHCREVTDAGIEHLRGLSRLNWLSLDSARISGSGLKHLGGLSQLRTLCLRDEREGVLPSRDSDSTSTDPFAAVLPSRIVPGDIKELQAALPDLKVALE